MFTQALTWSGSEPKFDCTALHYFLKIQGNRTDARKKSRKFLFSRDPSAVSKSKEEGADFALNIWNLKNIPSKIGSAMGKNFPRTWSPQYLFPPGYCDHKYKKTSKQPQSCPNSSDSSTKYSIPLPYPQDRSPDAHKYLKSLNLKYCKRQKYRDSKKTSSQFLNHPSTSDLIFS